MHSRPPAPPVFLGKPLESTAARAERWRALLAPFARELPRAMLSAEVARADPAVAVRARLRVLLEVYDGDYHTDAHDVARLAEDVEQGREHIFFWGAPAAVAQLRRLLGGAALVGAPSEDAALDLGTATLIDVSAIFGAGVLELTRTGSTSRSMGALAPNLTLLTDLFDQAPHAPQPLAHTVIATPRNRNSDAALRGGAAIQRMHARDLRSAFLGLAPWYEMQRGQIEVLDYRELYRDPSAVRRLIHAAAAPWLADPVDAAYARALIRLTFEDAPQGRDAAAAGPASFHIHGAPDAARARHQPLFIAPGGDLALERAIATAQRRDPACIVVRLPLSRASGAAQRALAAAGFLFSALEAPRPQAGARTWIGQWCHVRPGAKLAAPYYVGFAANGCAEDVLRRLRELIGGWSQGATAAQTRVSRR
jgi:hypothetical protein